VNAGAPVLGLCWNPVGAHLILGLGDNSVKFMDAQSGQLVEIGKH